MKTRKRFRPARTPGYPPGGSVRPRGGGERKSEWKRLRAAGVVRAKVDSLFEACPEAAVVVMGDLNGEADTEAQRLLCPANGAEEKECGELYNAGYHLLGKPYGSYCYRGRWQTLDHILVSGGMLNGEAAVQAATEMQVYAAPFLLEQGNRSTGKRPKPTYRGPRYIGGTSDHLPVWIGLRTGK